jgi:class 3 adenylate cyclase
MGAGAEVTDGRVQYARNGSVRLAYRVFGDADTALVGVPGWVSNVDFYDDPMSPLTGFKDRLAASTRYVVWDKRGTGLSDPVTEPPPLDERMDDLRAVMDAAGVEKAALWGGSEGGPLSLLFAATYPERVRSLVLYGAAARFSCDPPGYPWGWTPAEVDAQLHEIDDHWADGAMVELFLGSVADVEGIRELFGRGSRACASPTMAKLLWQALNEIDVRDILDSVTAPTLVLHRPGDRVVALEAGRDLAARLPNATFRELPPGDHVHLDILDLVASEILAFVVGNETAAASEDRVLATVLFTDIADSTETLRAAGDERWRSQLDVHDEIVERHVTTFAGTTVNHTGDGVFAVFDGPTKAARCALELMPVLASHGIRIRAGVHTGECERRGDDWSGIAVHVGARVSAMAKPGEVLATRTVRDLSAGSGLTFEDRGTHLLKGFAEEWQVFRVTR